MNTKSEPSRYRKVMSRRSTVAVSTLVPALKVRSTTLPDSTFFSVVRTKAPPLPGLTCWNSTTVHNWPSRFRTNPFFRSLVVATGRQCSCARVRAGRGWCALIGGVRPDRQILIFDADDTLWENNIIFDRVIDAFVHGLRHPSLE